MDISYLVVKDKRISIARALLKNSPIILLDEISSALDVENEFEIQQGINSLIKNKTVIVNFT